MAAIAIMGKSGFNLIIERIFSFLKKHGPPDRVSLTRYRIGLVMFVLPIVFGWLGPYTTYISVITYCVHFPGNCFFGKLLKSCDIILPIEILTFFPIQSAQGINSLLRFYYESNQLSQSRDFNPQDFELSANFS